MHVTELIEKKQAGKALSQVEIKWLVDAYTQGQIPDYQMSAFLMAVYFRGMNHEEVADLTLAMADSGERIDLSPIHGTTVDKHSTGGVGDTTTLILSPLVASMGGYVAKMSGRGLGHTGGTVDKLESIPGFQVELSQDEFIQQVNDIRCAVVGQSGDLAPADKKIYALRDVTGTVGAIPLIASSIMSKKIASGAEALVLDVKVGEGAFMKSDKEANQLALTMKDIGEKVGLKTVAVLSDMSQPLGYAIGNILEVKEAIDTLQGKGPKDLTELSILLASQMLLLSGIGTNLKEIQQELYEQLDNGQALACFKEMVARQAGDSSYIDDPSKFSVAKRQIKVEANRDGKITELNALELGQVAKRLGAGRESMDEELDLTAGIVLEKKVGDPVKEGDVIAVLHTNKSDEDLEGVEQILQDAISIGWFANEARLIHKLIQ